MIPQGKAYQTGKESQYLQECLKSGAPLSGDGPWGKKCESLIQKTLDVRCALLTPSCTASLDMTALLVNLEPEDEVIIPSFTFVSTANSYVSYGARVVFVDIDPATLNIDPKSVEAAITAKTKAIVAVHYAGVACDMKALRDMARKNNLLLIEDAAQAYYGFYENKALGSLGDMATFSFHATKNIQCGEAGALIVNNPDLVERAEIIREKGTNRKRFLKGEIDKYTWEDKGSSFLTNELTAAFLLAQLESVKTIIQERVEIWNRYDQAFRKEKLDCELPTIPESCRHNGHIYYLLLPDLTRRDKFIAKMKENGVGVSSHYPPLHLTPGGKKFGKFYQRPLVTEKRSDQVARLPIWNGLGAQQERVIDVTLKVLKDL